MSSKISSRQIDAKGSVVFFRIGTYKQSLVLVVAVASSQVSHKNLLLIVPDVLRRALCLLCEYMKSGGYLQTKGDVRLSSASENNGARCSSK